MQIIKYSGEREEFEPKKIYYSIREAGGSEKLAKEVMQKVVKKYHEGITTGEILDFTLELLKKEPGVSERYDLKRAIMSLGPSGFPFENFFAGLLEHYGYETQVGVKLIANNLLSEIDIIAEKNKKFLVECKYHNQPGIVTKIRYAKKIHETFLKLKKYHFDQPWLATNTRCSLDTIEYARYVNLKITSWKYPDKESLRDLIEKKKLYPITILKTLPEHVKEKLYNSRILIAKDLLKYSKQDLIKKTGLSDGEIEEILKKVKEIINE